MPVIGMSIVLRAVFMGISVAVPTPVVMSAYIVMGT